MDKVTIRSALVNALVPKAGVPSSGGWYPLVREPFAGAWQRNKEEHRDSLLISHAVYACITLRASDIAKCRLKLMQQDEDGIWSEISNTAHAPVLRKPNRYQTRIQFFQSWINSKDAYGNVYVLKDRDNRGVVTALHVLDPQKVKVLVAPDGSVYYQLSRDDLAGVDEGNLAVPASEIIHDMTTLRHHPLCGVPPLATAALAATHGLNIQRGSIRLFANGSRPSGFLTAPKTIDNTTAARLKVDWETNFGGDNIGRVAVMGDGLEYKPMAQSAADTQLIEQLGLSGKMVCSAFNVPAYMVGIGDPPAYNNIEALNQQYYSQCLQKDFEAIELLLDEGLGLTEITGKTYGTEFEIDDLLRMDTATKVKTATDAIRGGLFKPNESRKKFDLPEVEGGDEVYLQQQNFSLSALAKRDAKDDPFARATSPVRSAESAQGNDSPVAANDDDATDEDMALAAAYAGLELKNQLALLTA